MSASHFLFFFSSRRRHTRCGRDWSSDVCSSDLKTPCVIQMHALLRASPLLLTSLFQHCYGLDRKSTRLNSSHVRISYAVFCLKKKKTFVLPHFCLASSNSISFSLLPASAQLSYV